MKNKLKVEKIFPMETEQIITQIKIGRQDKSKCVNANVLWDTG